MATIPDKVNTGALATIVAVGAISMVGISAALTAMVRSEVDQRADQVGAKSDLGPYRKVRDTQLEELDKPKPDPNTGRAAVPIERAMDLVVEDLRQHPEHATAAPPPDAGKQNAAEGDAGAAVEPGTGEAGATGEETGSAPTEGTPEGETTGGAQPAEGQPAVGSEPVPAPTPGDPGAAPGEPETGNGKNKNKNKGARHAKAEPAAAPASPPAPPATP